MKHDIAKHYLRFASGSPTNKNLQKIPQWIKQNSPIGGQSSSIYYVKNITLGLSKQKTLILVSSY